MIQPTSRSWDEGTLNGSTAAARSIRGEPVPRRSVEDDDGTGGTARELLPLVVVRRIHHHVSGNRRHRLRARHEARRAVVARERIDHQDEPDQRPRHVVTTHVDVQTLRGGAGFDSPPVEGTELEVLADDPTGGFEDRLVDIQRIEDRIAIDEVGDARRARRIGRRPDVDGIGRRDRSVVRSRERGDVRYGSWDHAEADVGYNCSSDSFMCGRYTSATTTLGSCARAACSSAPPGAVIPVDPYDSNPSSRPATSARITAT